MLNTFCFAQIELPDSLRSKVENDSLFIELIYETKNYASGSKEYEGWSYTIPFPNQSKTAYLRIGTWRFYTQNGDIELEQFLPYEWHKEVISTQFKDGKLYFKMFINRELNGGKFEDISVSESYGSGAFPKIFCAKDYYTFKNSDSVIKREFCKSNWKDKDGEYFEYHQNGQVSIKGKYDHGKRIGEWTWYNENGNVLKSKTYT